MARTTPTIEAYAELQSAYDYFNKRLFLGALPPCLITLQRKGRKVMGYFSHTRFAHRTETKRTTDEIAMNPLHFATKNDVEVLQTLVHEMAHLWQAHFGKHRSRRAYHNREWAAQMQTIGLMPSSTGAPGGKTTGQHMSDYVITGGPFEAAALELLANGFKLSWYDRAADLIKPTSTGEDGEDGEAEAEPLSGKRVKYVCPTCAAKAWGKSTIKLICGDCRVALAPA